MKKIQNLNLSLGSRAYQEVKRNILARQIPPGGKLNEVELAGALGISRTPVREALNRLEKEGLVQIFPQRGAYVVQFSADDIYELFLIRENLEGLAAFLAAERVNKESLATLSSLIQGFSEPYSEKDIQRYAREDFKFHQTLITLSGSRRLMTLVSTLHDQIRMFRLTSLGLSGRMKTSLSEHMQITKALRAGNSEECERKMRQHIRHVRDGVMANVEFFIGNGKKSSAA
jgi:DNA-binding GntR family transcriptional regulator